MMQRNIISIVIPLFILLFPTVSAQDRKGKGEVKKEPLAFSEDWGAEHFYIPNISSEKIGKQGLSLPLKSRRADVLKMLFPGAKYYKIPDIESGGALWRSTNYKSIRVVHPVTTDDHYFPIRKGNYTIVNSILRYTDDSNRKWMLVVLESKEVMPLDELECCIPDGADMSLALFKKPTLRGC